VLALGLLERDPALQPGAAAAASSVPLLLDLPARHGGIRRLLAEEKVVFAAAR
jgi:hypothetical protein